MILNVEDCRDAWLSNFVIESACECITPLTEVAVAGLINPDKVHVKPLEPDSLFAQIFHVNENHWILASNIGTDQPSIVRIYDSMCSGHMPSFKFLHMLARFCRFSADEMTVHVMSVHQQPNSCDCGIFALAYAIAICTNCDPTTIQLASGKYLRLHLFHCLEAGDLSMFPSTRRACRKQNVTGCTYGLYCTCRGIDFGGMMVCCDGCDQWYHVECILSSFNSSENWMCHKCEATSLNLNIP